MSAIKNYYHDEICGNVENDDDPQPEEVTDNTGHFDWNESLEQQFNEVMNDDK